MADNLLYDGDNLDILRRYLTDESGDQVDLDPPSRATGFPRSKIIFNPLPWTLANQAARERPLSKSSKASRGNCMPSASAVEFTKYRARQRCQRTKAKQSAKVGSPF
jgi:hypothetical protein